jgi:hypothetical protein
MDCINVLLFLERSTDSRIFDELLGKDDDSLWEKPQSYEGISWKQRNDYHNTARTACYQSNIPNVFLSWVKTSRETKQILEKYFKVMQS